MIHEMIAEVLQDAAPGGIGAAVGGPLDWKHGVVSPLHQPRWRNVPLKQIIEARWRCPFRVDVDTNAAALGEYDASEHRPSRLLYVTVSTGMGGGLLVDGEIYRGMDGEHPEVGHQAVAHRVRHPERVTCDCGADDCLEAVVSGNGIRRVYGKPAEMLSKPEWAEVSANLALGLRNAAVIYLPDVIVLGGSVSLGGGSPLLETVKRVLDEKIRLVPKPRVQFARLGERAPLAGALLLARRAGRSL